MEQSVGNTPLVLLDEKDGSTLYGKIEGANPTGSIKARTALYMLRDYLNSTTQKDKGIVVNSGGNFALALSAMCAAENIPLVVSLLASAPEGFVTTLEEFGATVVRESTTRDERRQVTEMYEREGYTFLDQHNSPLALLGIGQTLPAEIWEQTQGSATDVVAGFGTGMTVFGNSIYFKKRFAEGLIPAPVTITAVEDDVSLLDFHIRSLAVKDGTNDERRAFLEKYRRETGRTIRSYQRKDGGIGKVVFDVGERAVDDIPGIGISGLQPAAIELLQMGLIDDVVQVLPQDAIEATKNLHLRGHDVGISSGAAYIAARQIFDDKTEKGEACCVVAIFPDTGTNYRSILYPFD
jgi:cysteine synthase